MKRKKLNQYMNLVSNKVGVADLFITGDIVDDAWWDDEVSPKTILDSLEKLEDLKTIDMYICSLGGSVVAGNSIHSILNTYKKKNNVTINAYISTAMSMATGIAMVADKIYAYKNMTFMIHKPSSMTWGNADDMRKEAEILDVFEEGLIANYMDRFKGTVEELKDLLEKETWLTAEQALEYGFVDEIIDATEMVACGKGIKVNNVLFERKEVVDILKTKITNKESEVKEMKYDECLLNQYGISEETFNAFENVSELLALISAKNNAEKEEEIAEAVEKAKEDSVLIDEAEAKEKLEQEEVTAEDIMNFAVIGKRHDPETENKLARYEEVVKERDLMKKETIEDALVVGRRAMGAENFNSEVWNKALNSMSYNDIKVMSKDWENKAKKELNAGVKQSVVTPKFENELVNKNRNYNV